ncbi:MAG: ATP-binding protein [Treponema sp.]|nr:ATP-binding protein [Treponema sp.]
MELSGPSYAPVSATRDGTDSAQHEAVAVAMLDRLLHHSRGFALKADSYRMKNRMKIGASTAVGGYAFE